MKIDELLGRRGEWLRGEGPLSEIVLSSRIRLARNIRGYPFVGRAAAEARTEIADLLRAGVKSLAKGREFGYFDMGKTSDIDRQVLVERHLISKQHAEADGSRGVAVSRDEALSIMINEEDHLRMQSIRSGFQLDAVWKEINEVDDGLEQRVEYAFHPRYGYLTACPTNVGTGIRVSVMLHLPALKLTNELERVFRAAKELRLAIRGFFGEGTEATGDLYQISNQVTLGRTEDEILSEFKNSVIPRIIEYEQQARKALLADRAIALDDRIWRSCGTLRYARSISSEETLAHLSHVRMGIHLGRITDIDISTVHELFLLTQPAHLQKTHGERLSGEKRSIARADYIRRRLNGS